MSELLPIPNHPGYFATRNGKIWSAKTNRWRRTIFTAGQLFVSLSEHNVVTKYQVGQLVLETFVGPCPPGMECRHLDGNPRNNDLENLRWGTHYENVQDSIIHGTYVRGETQGNSKLTNEQAAEIRRHLAAGVPRKELAKRFHVGRDTIRRIDLRMSYIEAA